MLAGGVLNYLGSQQAVTYYNEHFSNSGLINEHRNVDLLTRAKADLLPD